jgi:hypothetical protein
VSKYYKRAYNAKMFNDKNGVFNEITYISFSLGDLNTVFLEANEKLLLVNLSVSVIIIKDSE